MSKNENLIDSDRAESDEYNVIRNSPGKQLADFLEGRICEIGASIMLFQDNGQKITVLGSMSTENPKISFVKYEYTMQTKLEYILSKSLIIFQKNFKQQISQTMPKYLQNLSENMQNMKKMYR